MVIVVARRLLQSKQLRCAYHIILVLIGASFSAATVAATVWENDFEDDTLGAYQDIADWPNRTYTHNVDDAVIIDGAEAKSGKSLRLQ